MSDFVLQRASHISEEIKLGTGFDDNIFGYIETTQATVT
jgi:hypothetical protein